MNASCNTIRLAPGAGQRGAVALEFALISAVFFALLIGAMEMGRILFFWNTTAEATRLGARMAVVCDLNDADIKARMRDLFQTLADADIKLSYEPSSCTADDCRSVTVSINPGKNFSSFIPFVNLLLTLPAFTTTLSRESMRSTFDDTPNPVCQ